MASAVLGVSLDSLPHETGSNVPEVVATCTEFLDSLEPKVRRGVLVQRKVPASYKEVESFFETEWTSRGDLYDLVEADSDGRDTADRLREVALGVGWYLRAFFASLPVAVFPESTQSALESIYTSRVPKAEWILAYRAVVGSLPVTHRATLAHWLAFVNGQIDEHGSGLDAQTVAVKWSPALIHEDVKEANASHSTLAVSSVNVAYNFAIVRLLSNGDDILPEPAAPSAAASDEDSDVDGSSGDDKDAADGVEADDHDADSEAPADKATAAAAAAVANAEDDSAGSGDDGADEGIASAQTHDEDTEEASVSAGADEPPSEAPATTAAPSAGDGEDESAAEEGAEEVEPVDPRVALRPEWVPDDAFTDCSLCNAEFWSFRWRHHCRHCGGLVCDDCSKERMAIPALAYDDPVRVCDDCWGARERTPEEAIESSFCAVL